MSKVKYVGYDTDLHKEAYEYARREYCERYPGMTDNFRAIDSLINQWISSQHAKHRS